MATTDPSYHSTRRLLHGLSLERGIMKRDLLLDTLLSHNAYRNSSSPSDLVHRPSPRVAHTRESRVSPTPGQKLHVAAAVRERGSSTGEETARELEGTSKSGGTSERGGVGLAQQRGGTTSDWSRIAERRVRGSMTRGRIMRTASSPYHQHPAPIQQSPPSATRPFSLVGETQPATPRRRIHTRVEPVIRVMGSLKRASCQAGLQAAGAAFVLFRDEGGENQFAWAPALKAALCTRKCAHVVYADFINEKICSAVDLDPATRSFAQLVRDELDSGLDSSSMFDLALTVAARAYVTVNGIHVQYDQIVNSAMKQLPSRFPTLMELRIAIEDTNTAWITSKSIPFRESAKLAVRACLGALDRCRAAIVPSILPIVACGILSSSFNSARKEVMGSARAAFCVAFLSHKGRSYTLADRVACFATIASMDEFWKRLRNISAEAAKQKLIQSVRVFSGDYHELALDVPLNTVFATEAKRYYGQFGEFLLDASIGISQMVSQLLDNEIKPVRIVNDAEEIVRRVQSAFMSNISGTSPIDVALSAVDIFDLTPRPIEENVIFGRPASVVNVVAAATTVQPEPFTRRGTSTKVQPITHQQKDEDDTSSSDDDSPTDDDHRAVVVAAASAAVVVAPSKEQVEKPERVEKEDSRGRRVFDDWTSESSSSWLSNEEDDDDDDDDDDHEEDVEETEKRFLKSEIELFTSHLNDIRTAVSRYPEFRTIHPEDLARISERCVLPGGSHQM